MVSPANNSICLCVFVCGRHMWSPGSDSEGDKRAQYQRLERLPGPQDRWREGEDYAAARGLPLSEKGRRDLGVDTDIMS